MVSEEVHPHMHSRKKRKYKIEQSADCIQEFRSEKDSYPMDQREDNANSVKDGKNVDPMNRSFDPMDRISRLPEEVIHHILSFLRNERDAIRTSILSKKWRDIWYLYSVLIFDERKFMAGIGHEDKSLKEKMFRDYVSASMNAHVEKKLCIQRLVLHMTTAMTSFGSEDVLQMNHWLTLAKENDIKELDFHVNKKGYILPPSVFSAFTLTGLRLSSCNLGSYNTITLPNLKNLCLRKLDSDEHKILNLISCCHSVEDLRFIECSGLRKLCISNLIRLNRVEIHNCNKLRNVKISAPYLDTFWYSGKRSNPCLVDLEGCKSLKRLSLDHPQVTRDFCYNQISNFPLLEKLDLALSDKMKYVTIRHPQLRTIALKGCKKLSDVTVDTPNLRSFEFKGDTMPSIDILSPLPYLTNVKLFFEPKSTSKDVDYGNKFWPMMRNFIGRFDPQGYKLVLSSNKSIVIHEDMNNIRFAEVPDLCFEMIKSSAHFNGILYTLLRSRPVFLSVVSPVGSEFPKEVYEMIKNKDQDPSCCSYNTSNNKCWRHFLKDIKFQDQEDIKFEDFKAKDKWVASWYIWVKIEPTTYEGRMTTNLRLDWNSQ